METQFKRGVLALLIVALLAMLVGCGATESGSGGRVITGGDVTLGPGDDVSGLLVLGGNVVIPEGVRVEGDVAVAGGNVRLDGTIAGNVAMMGGTLSGDGEVLGELAAVGGSVSLANDPVEPPQPPTPPDAPEIDVVPPPPVEIDIRPERPPSLLDRLFGFIASVIGALVRAVAFGAMGLLVALFLPKPLQRTRAAAEADPLPALGVGCLSMPVAGFIAFFFAIIIIGIPVTIALVLAMMALAVLGWLAIGSLLGERLLRWADVRRPQFAATAAIGAAALSLTGSLLDSIPVVGGLAVALLWAWGIGAALLTVGGTRDYLPARSVAAVGAPRSAPPAPYASPDAPPSARDLYADLAADLGLDERDLRGPDDPTTERPVPPPER